MASAGAGRTPSTGRCSTSPRWASMACTTSGRPLSVLARSQQLLLALGLGPLVGLLDAGRVDAAVGDQLLEGEPADLAPDRLEAGQQDGLRRVVDDQVDARDGLVGADVAAFATDDAA